MVYVISQMSNISNFDSHVFLFDPFTKVTKYILKHMEQNQSYH